MPLLLIDLFLENPWYRKWYQWEIPLLDTQGRDRYYWWTHRLCRVTKRCHSL